MAPDRTWWSMEAAVESRGDLLERYGELVATARKEEKSQEAASVA